MSEEAKRQAFRQALAKAEGLIKSETINGVDYLWFGMPF